MKKTCSRPDCELPVYRPQCSYCTVHWAEYQSQRKRVRRLEAHKILGGKCVVCSYDGSALQIDHMNGGGTKENRQNPQAVVNRILKGNHDDLQLLCANCNWEKRYENQEHLTIAS